MINGLVSMVYNGRSKSTADIGRVGLTRFHPMGLVVALASFKERDRIPCMVDENTSKQFHRCSVVYQGIAKALQPQTPCLSAIRIGSEKMCLFFVYRCKKSRDRAG